MSLEDGIYIERPSERRGHYIRVATSGSAQDALVFGMTQNGTETDHLLALDRDGNVTMTAGNVGINTTSPNHKLFVVNSTTTDNESLFTTQEKSGSQAAGYSASGLQIRGAARTSSGNDHTTYINMSNRDPSLNGSHGCGSYITLTSPLSPGTYGTGQIDFYIRNGAPYSFPNDPSVSSAYWMSSLLTIQSNGNIGIGITTPANMLHIKKGSDGSIFRMEGATNRYLYSGTDGSGHYIEVQSTSTATRKLRLQAFDGSSVYSQLFIDAGSSKRVYTADSTRLTVGDNDSNSRPFNVDSEAISTEYKAINTNNGYICRHNGGWANFNDNATTVGCEVVLYSSTMDGEWHPFSVMVYATSCSTNAANTVSAWYYYRGRVYGNQNSGGFSVVLVDSGGDTGSFTISFNDDGAVGTTFGMGNISEARQFEIRLTGPGNRTAGTAFVTSYSGLARFRRQP